SGLKLDKVFDQYLRYSKIPVLEYKINDGVLSYRWITDVTGFDMPVKVSLKADEYTLVKPTNDWKTVKIDASVTMDNFKTEKNFYVKTKKGE
ncbi:MAG: M1 family peptidase, partial [Acinetobacter sp.]